MRKAVIPSVLVTVAAGLLVATAVLSWRADGTARKIEEGAERLVRLASKERIAVQKIITQVADTGGNVHTIETERQAGESVEAWLGRHMEAVNAAKAL